MELHKYVDEAGIDIIKNLRLKVSDPANLNDPFELCPRVDGEIDVPMVAAKYNDGNELDRLYDNFAMHKPLISREQFKNNAKARMNKIAVELTEGFSDMAKKYTREMQKVAKDFYRIACFSRPMNSSEREVLMWSHYTNGHKGMRIHFDSEVFPAHWERSLAAIKYRKKRVSIDVKDLLLTREQLQNSINESLITKSEVWSYENECRLFLDPSECFFVHSTSLDYVRIDPKSIYQIDLGHYISHQLQNEVYDLIRKSAKLEHVKIKMSKIDESEFKLNYVQIPGRGNSR